LYWIIVIKIEVEIKDNLTGFVIPAVMATISNLIWLRPRIKKLHLKNERLPSLYYMLVILANLWLMIVSANLLTVKANTIIKLKDISEIDIKPKSTFYTIYNFEILNHYSSSTYTIKRSGKNNKYVDFNLYFVSPISKKNGILNNNKNQRYWLVKSYNISENARKSDELINKTFNEFARNSEAEFHSKKYLERLDHFEKVQPSDLKIQGIEAIKKLIPNVNTKNIILLTASTSNLADKAKSYTKYIFISFFTGIGILFILLIKPKYRTGNPKKKRSKKHNDDLKEILLFFIPRGSHYITSILIDINIIVYVVLLFFNVDFMHPTAQQLTNFGGANCVLIASGQPWRLITAMFLHAGIGHLIYNMLALALIGHLVEPILGRKKYLILYIGSGLISGIAFLLLGKIGVSVGASGAVFGLFAVGFTFAIINKIKFLRNLIGIYAGSSLLLGFIIPGTDNLGHIGGVIGGLLIYYFMREIYPGFQDYEQK